MSMSNLRGVAAALLLLLGCLATGAVMAQTWSGLGPDNNWSTGANWSGGTAPASGSTTVVDFLASPRTSPVVDAPWTINRMDLFSAGGYAFSGQAITLAGAAPQINAVANVSVIANPIILSAPATAFTNLSLRFTGPISGAGSLAVAGAGGVSLEGINTYTGGTTVGPGVLSLTGSMLGPVVVSNAGRLGGSGTIGGPVVVNAGATLAPGGPSLGILATGSLTDSGFTQIAIQGPAQGTQYTGITVTGSVDLTGATLSLSGSYVPQPGDVFTIITNDAADAVAGTFAGLAQGATIAFNGVPLRISYVGGTGNDVTLSAPAAPIAPVPTLSQWGLMALATLVLGIGIIHSRRR